MPIPDFQTLMLPVLTVSSGGEVKISDVVETLADKFSLTDSERTELLPSGRQSRFANRVHWAKSYLGKAALIALTGRGRFEITERGKKVLAKPPSKIDIAYLERFPDFKDFRKTDAEVAGARSTSNDGLLSASEQTKLAPDELMRSAQAQLESALAGDILERLVKGSPDFFERAIIKMLTAMGYGGSAIEAARALGKSGDGGVDGVIDQDALGLDRVYVQAKRCAIDNSVGSGAIRDFFGSLDRFKATKGLFVTTSSFSNSARETAEYLSKRIVQIDGAQLTKLMIRFEVGCRVEEILFVKRLDEEFFE